MTSNESKQLADLIWSKLFSKQFANSTKEQELNAIESVIIKVAQDQRQIGRRQILNHFEKQVKSLRD